VEGRRDRQRDLPQDGAQLQPPAAMCGKVCVMEVEEIVPTGSLDPDEIHLPGIYVHRLIQGEHEKRIEQRTVRKREEA
jgi:3-oxoacid CoA-transferase subunit A